jgi:hypothetical protein
MITTVISRWSFLGGVAMYSKVLIGFLAAICVSGSALGAEITTCVFREPNGIPGNGAVIPNSKIRCWFPSGLGGKFEDVPGGLRDMYAKGWRLVTVANVGEPVAYMEKR